MKLSRLGALGLLGLALACEPASKPGVATTAQSNTIAVLQDGTVASLDADHNQLVLMGLDGSVRARVDVGQRPIQLTTRGNTVAVSNTGDRSVSLVDAARGEVTQTIPVGVEPRGLVFLPDGTLAVALGGERAVAVVDVAAGTVLRKLPVAQDNPYGLAVTGNKLYVTHLLGDALSTVDLQGGTPRAVPVAVDVGGLALNPSLSRSVTVSPDGNEVAMPNVNLNNEGLRPDAQQGGGGYLGTPDQMPAVNPTLTVLDTRQDVMISKSTPADVPMGGFLEDCFDCGAPAPTASRAAAGTADPNGPASALLTQTNGTVPFDAQLNDPIQTAYLANGRGVAVLARGSRNLFIWRRDLQGQRRELLQVTPVGHGADGMAVTADGKQLLVHNAFDLTVDVVSLPEIPEAQEGSFLGRKFERTPQATTGEAPVKRADRTLTVAQLTLPADVAAGRRLFHDATLPSMTQGPGITCGTCHADGRNDNKTWMFIDGPRNTQSLAAAGEGRIGLATTTAPLHWKGEITTHLDLQRTVTEFMGGSGLNKTQLDQLAAFIDTIPAADNPVRDDESRFAELIRGEELFNDTTVGCASCHSGPHFTDNKTHEVQTDDFNVPTRDGRTPVAGFQTPVLHGVMFTAPYGHDGRYPTLEDLLEDLVRGDKMGKGSHLSDADMRALATYLRSL